MRRILLCGMENLRDLGGYPALAGRGSERFTRGGQPLPRRPAKAGHTGGDRAASA